MERYNYLVEQRGAAGVTANIRAEIARANLTQTHLAEALGLTQQSVSDRMRGRTPFTVDELLLVAALLNIPVTRLVDVEQVAS